MLQKIATNLRKSSFVKNNSFRRLLKTFSNIIARVIYGSYKQVSIGKKNKFLLNSKFAFSNYENWGDSHNKGFVKLLELSKNKNVVFDIGAHIGLCLLPLSKTAKKVYGFEASDVNRKYLEQHIKVNNINNAQVVPYLVGDVLKEDVVFFDVKGGSGVPTIANLSKINSSVNPINTNKKQISLDIFCLENNVIPDVIKIDVEGAEFFVLDGAKELILKHKPDIVISLHPKHLKNLGRNINEIFDYCNELSYKLVSCIDNTIIKESQLCLDEFYMRPIV